MTTDRDAELAAQMYPDMATQALPPSPVKPTVAPFQAQKPATPQRKLSSADAAARMYPDMAQPPVTTSPTSRAVPPRKAGPESRPAAHTELSPAETAARLYPDMAAEPPAPARSPSAATSTTPTDAKRKQAHDPTARDSSTPWDAMYGDSPREAPGPAPTADDLVAEPLSDADRVHPEGGHPLDTADAYNNYALGEFFDALARDARHDGDTEEAAILAEGRQQAAALLHEMAVPAETASGIARELDTWNSRWIKGELADDDELTASRKSAEDVLREEWGAKYAARIELAQQAYKEAAKRLPWLRNLVEECGAGNSANLIRHFATVGLNNARNRRGTGKNRR